MNPMLMPLCRRSRLFLVGLLGCLLVISIACTPGNSGSLSSPNPVDNKLRVFWNRGFYAAEDQALQKVAADWQQKYHTPIDISFFSPDDIQNQAAIALESGNPPDIVFAHRGDYTLAPRWALDGKLADVSDVLKTKQSEYSDVALKAATFYNKVDRRRAYYGVPIQLQTIHIHYWRDLLEQAGLSEADIPNDWDGFWNFWQQAQDRLRQQGTRDIYGLGLPLSTRASDTYFLFEQVLDAYDIKPVDQQGQLRLTDPTVRQGMINALTWLTQFYKDQYVPTDALNWLDADNNTAFLNRKLLMTVNPSLSIPASQRDDDEVYLQQIATREFPNKPNGEPNQYLISVKQAFIFQDAKQVAAAKRFLIYLIEPDRLNTYIKESLGRWLPAMPSAYDDPYWKNGTDPHIAVATKQFLQRPHRPFYYVLNPAYSRVQGENIWGQAIKQVLVDGKSPTQAIDEAIAQIQTIYREWQQQL